MAIFSDIIEKLCKIQVQFSQNLTMIDTNWFFMQKKEVNETESRHNIQTQLDQKSLQDLFTMTAQSQDKLELSWGKQPFGLFAPGHAEFTF